MGREKRRTGKERKRKEKRSSGEKWENERREKVWKFMKTGCAVAPLLALKNGKIMKQKKLEREK